jgi:hypothetical protein
MTRLEQIGRRATRGLGPGLVLIGLALGLPSAAEAQAPQRLDDRCIVSVLNRNVRVKPDGTWVLPNIPANFGLVRARATCIFDGLTVSGESAPFLISPNGSIDVPPIVLGSTTPIPQQVTVTSPAPQLGQVGQTVQLSVTARFPDGTSREVSGAAAGTRYVISNPAIATVTANGLVTAVASGTVLVQATNEGTAGFTSVRVVLSADSDGDGIPDDLELTLGLNPNNAADAFEDIDRDGLSNRDEALGGTDLRQADTDLDGLSDGEEVRPGSDGFITNPLSVDTDGDGVRDALEVASGSNPADASSTNLAQALTAMTVAPASFTITVNSVLGVGSQQLLVTGQLRDGTSIDLTSTARGTNYASNNLDVCNFGSPDGRVFGANNGACTITVTNAGFAATAQGSVTNFQPTPLSSLAIPGYANNVDVNGGFAYVAAGSTGLQVVNVSNPAAPVIVGSLDTPGNANDVRVVGSRVYVADGSSGLRIIDVTSPATPVLLGALDTPGDASDVVVEGDLAYVADGASGVHIINVSLPASPQLVRSIETGGTARGVDVENGIVVVANDTNLRVIDATSPGSASAVGLLPLSGQIIDVDLANGFAVVAAYTGGVHIVDVRTPSAPAVSASLPGSAPGGFVPRDVQVAGRFALFAEQLFANAVAPIVDVGDPAQPFFRGVLDFGLDYAGTGIAISGPHVYWTGQSFVVSSENGTTGTTRLFIGQYIAIEDRAGVAPTITLTQPVGGATAIEGGQLTVRADARDDVAVASVTFTVNDAPAFTDTSEPFEARVTVPPVPGPMVVGARVTDYGGNSATAAAVPVTVIPDPLTTVVGRVIDRNSAAVAGATVTVLGRSATSGGDGAFLIASVPTVQGALTVQATAVIEGRNARGFSAATAPVPSGTTNVGDVRISGGRVALLHCDSAFNIRTALIASGLLTADDIVELPQCATPTAAQLADVSGVLVWTNSSFGDPNAVGDALANFVDQGGGVVIATYGMSTSWRIGGRFQTEGYSPLVIGAAPYGPSGRLNLAASNTAHPLMAGVTDTAQTYFVNSNYTNPPLAPGATLVAVDTGGANVVAVSPSNRVVAISIFPGFDLPAPIQRLFANAVDFVR